MAAKDAAVTDESRTEIPLTDGMTYHLQAKGPIGDNQNIARRIVLVGDPERVEFVSKHFDEVTFTSSHREIRVATGKWNGVWVSCISTGMGTDNTEIVVTELHVLHEFDIAKSAWREGAEPLIICRLGTCGSPRETVHAGDMAVSAYALGSDTIGKWYPAPSQYSPDQATGVTALTASATTHLPQAAGWIYSAAASPVLVNALAASSKTVFAAPRAEGLPEGRAAHVGITYTAPGFYGPQGRAVGRLAKPMLIPDITSRLLEISAPAIAAIDADAVAGPASAAGAGADAGAGGSAAKRRRGDAYGVVNIEMEAASLFHLSSILGYTAGAACLVVASRPPPPAPGRFLPSGIAQAAMNDGVRIVLGALVAVE